MFTFSYRKKLEEWVQSVEKSNGKAPQLHLDGPAQQSDHDDINRFPVVNSQAGPGPPPPPSHSRSSLKCDEESEKQRDLGNTYFKKKDLKKSLFHYNQAIKLAPFPDAKKDCTEEKGTERNSLALALANRSAVYHEFGKPLYDKSLKDINLALKYGYPERLKTKLLTRKADIYVKKGKKQLAQECLAIIKSHQSLCKENGEMEAVSKGTKNMPMGYNTDARIDSIEMQIKELLGPDTSSASEKMENSSCMEAKNRKFSQNPNFENARDSISIKISDTLGRHVIALTDLSEGQVLFQEDPFASVLLPDFNESHCHHCHKSLIDETGEVYYFP